MTGHISHISLLDEGLRAPAAEIEQERRVAMYDLIEENKFALRNGSVGPYRLSLGRSRASLQFTVSDEDERELDRFVLALDLFRQTMKDYGCICSSYFEAVKSAQPSEIERMDEARRAIHAEGGRLVREGLSAHVDVDAETSRRLFTLLCALSE